MTDKVDGTESVKSQKQLPIIGDNRFWVLM